MNIDPPNPIGCGFLIVCALAALAIIFFAVFVPSCLEARAFNRATGSDVSAWEAIFVQLRVEGRAK